MSQTFKTKKDESGANIAALQEQVKEMAQTIKFASFSPKEKEVLYRTVKLNEEVGELCNDILAVLALQRKSKLEMFDKRNLYEEFGDVILTTMQLANSMNVNLQRAVNDKVKKIKQRATEEKPVTEEA